MSSIVYWGGCLFLVILIVLQVRNSYPEVFRKKVSISWKYYDLNGYIEGATRKWLRMGYCSGVSIFDFEQLNAGWVSAHIAAYWQNFWIGIA